MQKAILRTAIALCFAIVSVPTAFAADGSVNTPLGVCTINNAKRNCAVERTTTITVPHTGTYRIEVVVERGNHVECQDQESFFMTINGQRSPIVADPGACEPTGTVDRQKVGGTYQLNAGANTIVLRHAYTRKQAKSIESLTVKAIEAFYLPPAVNAACGKTHGTIVLEKPTTGLCAAGTATSVSGSAALWTWKCVGSGGGATVDCHAKEKEKTKPVCGSANGKSYSVAPTSGLCKIGTASGVREVDGKWKWECANDGETVRCEASKARVAIAIDKQNGDKSGDKQKVRQGGTATFTISVMNSGEDVLTNVVIDDPAAKDCNRTAAQTAKLYGDTFEPKETFSYTCTQSDVRESYNNVATVTATTTDGKTKLTVCDDSDVTVETEKEPEPEPQKPTPPTDKPKKKKQRCDASIGDLVWHDRNKNGVQDNGEEGIADVRLKLYNGNDVERKKTNGSGKYSFKDLCEGTYTVVVDAKTLPKGCYQVYDRDGKLDNKTTVKLDNDEHYKKADFGYYCPSASVSKKSPKTGPGAVAAGIAAVLASGASFMTYRRMTAKA